MRRSMEPSVPVFSSVVIARVAMERLESDTFNAKSMKYRRINTIRRERGFGETYAYQALHIVVAFRCTERVSDGDLGQCAHGGESERGLGRGQEELQHGDGRGEVVAVHAGQLAHGLGRLVYHQLTLVAQASLQELVRCFGIG